jgi:predicted ATPase/DNA-binding SARP family transcriptional activator
LSDFIVASQYLKYVPGTPEKSPESVQLNIDHASHMWRDMPATKIFFLGTPRIEYAGESIHLQRRKALALLAYLTATNQAHSRDVLATLLWHEYDQKAALAGLRRALSSLKRYIGSECFEIERDSISILCAQHLWVDIHEFRERIHQWQSHDHSQEACPECMASLLKAVELYRDDFMSGFNLPDCPDFDDWQGYERQRFRSDLAGALKWLSDAHATTEKYKQATDYTHRWLLLDNLEEAAHRQLVRLYALAGQRAAALRQYDKCSIVLEEELGVEPSEETQALHKSILENRLQPPMKEKVDTSEPFRERPKHNLPFQLTPFIGRERELEDIVRLMDDPKVRLLTVLGSGGVGKTRLALEAAKGLLDNYKNGVFFVSLAPLESVQSIVPAIAEAAGFSFYEGVDPRQQILNYLERKNMLLVMDNYEHLLQGVDIVADILKTAPDVKVLATSRSRLNLSGEQRYPLAGMDFPDPISQNVKPLEAALGFSSVKLFVNCALRAQPDFELDAEDLPYAVRICRVLGGVPLAIRLAAAWVELLSLRQIADEIEKSIDFLETEQRDVPERQRSMRAVFDHSWKLLSEGEKAVFTGLSVFRGGFTLEAAQAVTGTSLRTLMVLVDLSLVQRESGERFTIHELLRQYASERLKEAPVEYERVKDKHTAFYCDRLDRWESELKSARQVETLEEMDLEIENCRIAWEWAAEQLDTEKLFQAMESFYLYHLWRRRLEEGIKSVDFAIDKLNNSRDGTILQVLCGLSTRKAYLVLETGQRQEADVIAQETLKLLDDPSLSALDTRKEKAYILGIHSLITYFLDLREDSLEKIKQCWLLSRETEDRWLEAMALTLQGSISQQVVNYAEGRKLLESGLELFRVLGDQRGIAFALGILGFIAANQGRGEEADSYIKETIAIQRIVGDKASLADSLRTYCEYILFLVKGQFSDAIPLLKESLEISVEIGRNDLWCIASLTMGLSFALQGKYDESRILYQNALSQAQKYGYHFISGVIFDCFGEVALAEGSYKEAEQLIQKSLTDYSEYFPLTNIASYTASLGIVACKLGKLNEAKQHFRLSLRSSLEREDFYNILECLPGIALLKLGLNHISYAIEIYALILKYPLISNSKMKDDIFGKQISSAAACLPLDVVSDAQKRGHARDLWDTARELLAELEIEANGEDIYFRLQ